MLAHVHDLICESSSIFALRYHAGFGIGYSWSSRRLFVKSQLVCPHVMETNQCVPSADCIEHKLRIANPLFACKVLPIAAPFVLFGLWPDEVSWVQMDIANGCQEVCIVFDRAACESSLEYRIDVSVSPIVELSIGGVDAPQRGAEVREGASSGHLCNLLDEAFAVAHGRSDHLRSSGRMKANYVIWTVPCHQAVALSARGVRIMHRESPPAPLTLGSTK